MEEKSSFFIETMGLNGKGERTNNKFDFNSAKELNDFISDGSASIKHTTKIGLEGKEFKVTDRGDKGIFVGRYKADNFMEKQVAPLISSDVPNKVTMEWPEVKPTILGGIQENHPMKQQIAKESIGFKPETGFQYNYNHIYEYKQNVVKEGVKAYEDYKNGPTPKVEGIDLSAKQADLESAFKEIPKDYYTRNAKPDAQKLSPAEIDARVVDNAKVSSAAIESITGKEYEAGTIEKIKNADLLSDKGKSLESLTKLESQLEQEATNQFEKNKKGLFSTVLGRLGIKPKIEESLYRVENEALKGGVLEGNYGATGESGIPNDNKLGSAKATVSAAKEELINKRYTDAGNGVYYHNDTTKKMNRGALDDFGIKNVEWAKGEGDSMVGNFEHEGAKHRINASYGKNDSISKIEISKFDGKSWNAVEDTHSLSKLTSDGVARSEASLIENNVMSRGTLSKAAEKISGIFKADPNKAEIKTINAELKPQIKALNKLNKEIDKVGITASSSEYGSTISQKLEKAEQMKQDIAEKRGRIVELKGSKALGAMSGATENVAKSKSEMKAASQLSKEEILNFNKMKSTINTAAEGSRVNTAKIVETVSKTASKVEQNVGAMANNAPKGMPWFAKAAIAGMAFVAIKAISDNSTEQRRQKQLELMSLRQQYGSSVTSY